LGQAWSSVSSACKPLG